MNSKTIQIGLVGFGYWGPNLARNIAENSLTHLRSVCDLDPTLTEKAKKRYPYIETYQDIDSMLNDPDLDAVAVATPVSSHFSLALSALKAGKHVLIEKPMAETSAQCSELISTAQANGLTLMVDHTFVYTGYIKKIKELLTNGDLGTPYYYDSIRVNLGLFQHDVNVVSDLAIHDFSILDFLIGRLPHEVSATAFGHVRGHPENIANVALTYEDGFTAHINVNWLAPVKVRQTLLGGSQKMVVLNDLEPSEKVKVYDKGISVTEDPSEIHRMRVGYRAGDMWAPQFDRTEALTVEINHFASSIMNNTPPQTDGHAGLRVVKMIEAANQSAEQRGAPVVLSQEA